MESANKTELTAESSPAPISTARLLARDATQKTWELLKQPSRSPQDRLVMLTAASASLRLWELVGSDVERARGHWLVSHAFVATDEAKSAVAHARYCERFTETATDAEDFDQAYAAEAMARAYALSGNLEGARTFRERATGLGKLIRNPEVQATFVDRLQSGPWFELH